MAKTLTVYLAADLKKFSSGMNQAQQQVGGFSGSLKNVLGPALIAAGAAAGAFAAKLAVDGVKAAVEDEAAVAKLATTLSNLGFDDALGPLEAWIAELELSAGVVDNDLRAAFERLVRSTGDVEEAQKAVSIAVDISASKGKDLAMVADSLGKAYDGQVTSLQRLGLGISNTTILSRDMDAVTSELQTLFAGQAAAAAQTYQGQLDRLGIAFDNLKESFGAGFLNALSDTNGQTDELMETMKDLQPVVEAFGEWVGDNGRDIAFLAGQIGNLTGELSKLMPEIEGVNGEFSFLGDLFNPLGGSLNFFAGALRALQETLGGTADESEALTGGLTHASIAARDAGIAGQAAAPGIRAAGDAAGDSGKDAAVAAIRFATLGDAMNAVGSGTFNWRREVNGSTDAARDAAIELNWAAYVTRRLEAATEDLTTSTGGSSTATEKATEVSKKLVQAYNDQDKKVTATREELAQYTADLNVLKEAAEAYADVIRGALGDALDLGAAYAGQFNKEGESTGISLYEGFQQQVDQLEWFGNVLNALKAQGADASFIAAVAGEGAAVGGALGQQMLDDGMVPAMAESWVNVQNKIDELTAPLIPDFLQTGIALGGELVTGLGNRLEEEVKTLAKLGKNMGKPVGAAFKAQIAKDVAEAVRNVEAAATAARAEKVAQAEAAALRLTQQAAGDAFARIVADADKRNGRNVAPVLT